MLEYRILEPFVKNKREFYGVWMFCHLVSIVFYLFQFK